MKRYLLAELQFLALAEAGWSNNTVRNREDLTKRLDCHYDVPDISEIHYFTEE
jgi:hypothetical protein